MLGHLLVYFRDQCMVHRVIKVNLNITVFMSAHFLGVFKKSQTLHKPSGCENNETSFLRFLFLIFMMFFQVYLRAVN
jgi:hypothetical protein